MEINPNDFFEGKAKDYDRETARTKNVSNIAQLMISEAEFKKSMNILDFGSGTGLLLTDIAPLVKKITAIDISKSMNEVLESKRENIACELEIVEKDLTKEDIDGPFDAVISSMTIHHVEDVSQLFKKFYHMLPENGILAIADLEAEDGSFHTVNTGVYHYGFDKKEFLDLARNAGFKNLKIQTASIIEKPYGKYPVFLLTGCK